MHPQSETTEVVFKSGSVVQLVRIHACHAWGRGFESRPHRKSKALKFKNFGVLLFNKKEAHFGMQPPFCRNGKDCLRWNGGV